MKKNVLLTLLIFFTLGIFVTMAVLFVQYNTKKNHSARSGMPPTAHADWPIYDFNRIMNEEADLIVFVAVESIENKKVSEGKPDKQLSTLQINEVLYSKTPNIGKSIVLNQAVDYVKLNASYLLFLRKDGEYYYEVDGNSMIPEENGMYEVYIEGIEGKYTENQFASYIKQRINEVQ